MKRQKSFKTEKLQDRSYKAREVTRQKLQDRNSKTIQLQEVKRSYKLQEITSCKAQITRKVLITSEKLQGRSYKTREVTREVARQK